MTLPSNEVSQLLSAWCQGDETALERLVPLVEGELRRMAKRYLNNEASSLSLEPTALVNEAYLRLIEWKPVEWQDRVHFFAVAAKMMRRVLVNHAIRRRRHKRGGSKILVSLAEAEPIPTDRSADVIALDEALIKLSKFDERKSQLVELRFFGGLTEEEAAEALKSSVRTVQREWSLARAWLFRELSGRVEES
jgi:RNA polymerase sigma factor (TIGR02999 family)